MLGRRAAIAAATLSSGLWTPPLSSSSDVLTPPPLSPRLDAKTLVPLTKFGVASRVGDLRYPSWMLGTWRVTNTISSFSMPLGSAFVDPFTRAIAEEDIALAQPLKYLLRFVPTDPPLSDRSLCVAQDRKFNAIEEQNAFLGPDGGSVREGLYACSEPDAPHGRLVLSIADPPEDGNRGSSLASPSAIISRVDLRFEWVQWDLAASGAFVTSEIVRQRTTRPRSTYEEALDEEQYLEIITSFRRVPRTPNGDGSPLRRQSSAPTASASTVAPSQRQPEVLRVRNRLVQYLDLPGGDPPGGAGTGARSRKAMAAIAADGRSVSFFDYDWEMERIEGAALDELRQDVAGTFGSPRFT